MPGKATDKDREALQRLQTVATELQGLLEGADDLIERLGQDDAPAYWAPDSIGLVGDPRGEWRPIGGWLDNRRGELLDALDGILHDITIALNPEVDFNGHCERHGALLQTLPGGEVVCIRCGRPASTPTS